MPTVRWRVTTSTVNGRIYVIGGVDDMFVPPDSRAIPTVEEYDPVADKWTEKADMPMSRFDHACSATGGKIYVFGGYGSDFDWETSVLEYDTGFSGEKVNPEGKLPTTWGNVRTALGKRYWQ
jgi:N-acetylneuraminic acid mutarotase